MELKYRLYRPEDVPVISKLWQSSTEWGALSPALVSRHLENAAFGKPIFSVAENVKTGEIVGQAVLMPSLISVKGNPVTAFRPMAAIVDHTLRVQSLNPLQHPIFRLFRHGFDEMRRRGEKLVFVLPDPRWRREWKGRAPKRKCRVLNGWNQSDHSSASGIRQTYNRLLPSSAHPVKRT